MKKSWWLLFALHGLWAGSAEAVSVKVRHELQDGGPSRIHAEGVLNATPEAVWDYLIRFNDYSKFMPRVRESFFISLEGVERLRGSIKQGSEAARKIAENYRTEMPRKIGKKWEGMVFMALDLPFPVKNRWYIIRAIQDETQGSRRLYQRCWSFVTGNIAGASGCWNLSPTDQPTETLARYEDNINPGGHVPHWIAELGADQTVPQIFDSLERVAQVGVKKR